MKTNQLNKGQSRHLMYVENKDGDIDGASARIGFVEFSRSGKSIYYRGRMLTRTSGQGLEGNYVEQDSGDEYWVSGVKRRGSNTHPQEVRIDVLVDEDAEEEYRRRRKDD